MQSINYFNLIPNELLSKIIYYLNYDNQSFIDYVENEKILIDWKMLIMQNFSDIDINKVISINWNLSLGESALTNEYYKGIFQKLNLSYYRAINTINENIKTRIIFTTHIKNISNIELLLTNDNNWNRQIFIAIDYNIKYNRSVEIGISGYMNPTIVISYVHKGKRNHINVTYKQILNLLIHINYNGHFIDIDNYF